MTAQYAHVAITGGSSGIGAALACAHADVGVRLSLSGRDAARLASVAEACRQVGAVVETSIVDVSDAGAVRSWIETVDTALPLDVVYANAGLGGLAAIAGPFGERPEDAAAIAAINFAGVVATVGAAALRMGPRGRGRIALVGSLAGSIALPQSPVYCASKAAVSTYAEAMRRLLAKQGVSVTLIEPGFVSTPMSVNVPGGTFMAWKAARAAASIRQAVDARRAVLRFPLLLSLVIGLASFLPRVIVDAVLAGAMRRMTVS